MNASTYKVDGMKVRVAPLWTIFANQHSRRSHAVTIYGFPSKRGLTVRTFSITEITQ